MASLETTGYWETSSAASTGGLKALNVKGYAQGLSFGIESDSGCTCTMQIQARMGSSAGPYAVLSTVTLSTGAFSVDQFLGPLEWVRPYVVAKTTGVLKVWLLGC